MEFHGISRNPEILWIPAEMQKTLAARNGPQQIGPDLENPKENHTFWRCRFSPEM